MKSYKYVSVTLVMTALTVSLMCACSASSKRPAKSGEIPDELSLREDRTALDTLRKDIPDETRKENDELALIMKDMAGGSYMEPSKVRDRFNKALRDRRELMDREIRKERETFGSNEIRTREKFLRDLERSRDKFNSKKSDAKARQDFYSDQDKTRRDFFADQADKRKDFEATITTRRKDFEDYTREKSNQFNQEYRAYSANYQERRTQEEKKKRMDEKAKYLEKQKQKTVVPVSTSGGSAAQPTDGSAAATGTVSDQDRALMEEMNQAPKGKITPLQTGHGSDGQ